MRIAFICLLAFCSLSVEAQSIKDTIFLSNGSRVIGKLKKAKLGVVTFDPDDANDITVQLRKLSAISAPGRIFRIETIHQGIQFGALSPSTEKGQILVWSLLDTTLVNLLDISVLYPFENNPFKRVTGYVGLGFNYTRSTGFGRINFDEQLRYATKKIELTVSASTIYSVYDTAFSRDKEDVYLKNNYYFSGDWFITSFLAYQRNLALSLERRFQEGLGVGNKFITTQSVYSWARGGLVLNQERSTENISTGTLTELFGEVELNFFRFEVPKIQCIVANTVFYSLSQQGRIRNDLSVDITWELVKNFKLNIELYSNFDSKPPATGSRELDYGTVVGFRYDLY